MRFDEIENSEKGFLEMITIASCSVSPSNLPGILALFELDMECKSVG